jgi:hypothetical protein
VSCMNDVCSNAFHGKLLQIMSLLSTILKHVKGATYDLGNNKQAFDAIRQQLDSEVLSSYDDFVRNILLEVTPSKFAINPVIVVIMLRIAKSLFVLVSEKSKNSAAEILCLVSSFSLREELPHFFETFQKIRQDNGLQVTLPFSGVLKREAWTEIIPILFALGEKGTLYPETSSLKNFSDAVCRCPSLDSSCNCENCPICLFLDVLDNSVSSENRFGVTDGIVSSLPEISFGNANLKPNLFIKNLVKHNILLRLLGRCVLEPEPPLAARTAELLCSILHHIDIDDLKVHVGVESASRTQDIFEDSCYSLWHVMRGERYIGILRKELVKSAEVRRLENTKSFFKLSIIHESFMRGRRSSTDIDGIAPTTSAACALQVTSIHFFLFYM